MTIALFLVSAAALADPPRSPRVAAPRVAALAKRLAAHEPGAEDAFWHQLAAEGTPVVEDINEPGHRLVTFFWRGTATTQRVELFGLVDRQEPESQLSRIPGSNVFTTSLSLPDSGRYTYFFIVDGDPALPFQAGHLHHDPLNKHPFDVTSSVLELPRAPPQPAIVAHAGVATGTLWRHTIHPATAKQERQLFVYTPPGYSVTGPAYPLVVAFDAESVTGLVPLPLILDELIAAKRIPPVVALLIGNVDRTHDLKPNAPFTDFVALDLVPWVRDHYHATSDPRRTVISGISLGGLESAYAAFRHPEVFGNVLSQSGSFWWGPEGGEPEATARDFANSARLPLRFWMEVGSAEFGAPRRETTQLAANRHLRDVLKARGYDVTYQEFAGNHTYICWRGTIADGLVALLAAPPKIATVRAPKAAPRPAIEIAPAKRSGLSFLLRAALLNGGDSALADAKRAMGANVDPYILDEDEINTVGCLLLMLDHARDSVPLLRWNTERFPKSWNTWDSLAWAYVFLGERVHAVENFKQELVLDPKNPFATSMLGELSGKP
jgi:enterochelin esterase-like enzyme